MTESKKEFRPKARLPRGFRDRFGEEIRAERDMLERIVAVYERYGFDPLETPAFEYADALGKFLPDTDRPNEGVFALQDEDGQWMSLRYDLTAPLARHVAENYDALPKPFRRYAVGPVWRNEKPGPGRYRQFTQCDADTVGAPAPDADVECVVMLADALDAATDGLGYVIRVNDRNVLTGLLEAIGIDEARDAAKKLGVLRAMDKFDRLGTDGVARLLGPGRKDESGDFTSGAGLADADIARVLGFLSATGADNASTVARLADIVGGSAAGAKGVETLSRMSAQLARLGIDERRAKIDLSVIRGLEYYTGPVFEAELGAPLV
ncbi:MAG: histidine--tRNA ligase family protein, partial [Parvularculaceae bacterium]|nr:histidine--tRNA ligase family protein [Parvularculaceae bacterium]